MFSLEYWCEACDYFETVVVKNETDRPTIVCSDCGEEHDNLRTPEHTKPEPVKLTVRQVLAAASEMTENLEDICDMSNPEIEKDVERDGQLGAYVTVHLFVPYAKALEQPVRQNSQHTEDLAEFVGKLVKEPPTPRPTTI